MGKRRKTLSERLDACGDDFDAIWKIVSVPSNRRKVRICLDDKLYGGEMWGPQTWYECYVFQDDTLGYILSDSFVRRRGFEVIRPLSELPKDEVVRIKVHIKKHLWWTWHKEKGDKNGHNTIKPSI